MDIVGLFAVLAPVLAIGMFFLFILGVLLILRTSGSGRNRSRSTEETREVQEVHQALVRMEKRIEALETILLERGRNREEEFDRKLRE